MGEALTEYRGIITGVPVPRQARLVVFPGLTDQEAAVLQALVDLREAQAEAVAKATGLRRPELTRSLDRLVALNYAIKEVEAGKTIYRPVARVLG